jgi:hypothetical protein
LRRTRATDWTIDNKSSETTSRITRVTNRFSVIISSRITLEKLLQF